MASKGCIISAIINIIVLFSSLAILLLYIYSDTNAHFDGSYFRFIDELGENWSKGPITNIFINDNNCTKYQDSFITDKWEGTVSGCKCASTITREVCNKGRIGTQKDCLDIEQNDPIKYRIWNKKVICAERYPASYLNLVVTDKTCPTDHPKQCGYVDSLNNILCVKNEELCPINDIKFMELSDPVPPNRGFQIIFFDNKKVLYFRDNINGKLLDYTKVSEEAPCVDPSYQHMKYENSSYILNIFNNRETCSADKFSYVKNDISLENSSNIDTNYQLLDTYQNIDFLKENKIYDILTKLPNYKLNTNIKVGLYTRNYVGLKSTCKSNLLKLLDNNVDSFYDELKNNSKNINEGMRYSEYFFFFLNIIIIVQFGVVILWFLVNLLVKSCARTNYNANDTVAKAIGFIVGLAVLTSIVTMGLCIAFTIAVFKMNNRFNILSGCLDDISNLLLYKFVNFAYRVINFSIYISILSGVNCIFLIIDSVVWSKFKDFDDSQSEKSSRSRETSIEVTNRDRQISTINDLKKNVFLINESELDSDSSRNNSLSTINK